MILKLALVVWVLFIVFMAGVATSEVMFSQRRAEIVDRLELHKSQLRHRLMELEK